MIFTKLAMGKLHQSSSFTSPFSRSLLRPCKSIINPTTTMDHPKHRVIIDHSHHIMYMILLFGLLLISIILIFPSNTPFFPLQLSIFNPSKLLHETVYYKDDLERALTGASTENKTDTDVLWLRNPFPNLYSNQSIDLQISTDKFKGSQRYEENSINTGFYMIKSITKTIALLDAWYAGKDNDTGWKEQDILIKLMNDGMFKQLGLTVRFLDTLHFSGFCHDSEDVNVVATVHANCCRSISAKFADLTAVLHDWRRFKNVPSANQTSTSGWTQHVNCWDSWKN